MLNYCLTALILLISLVAVNAKPQKSASDADAVVNKISKYAKKDKVKRLQDVPFSVIASEVRNQLKKHVNDPRDVTDNKYFALLEEVVGAIIPGADE